MNRNKRLLIVATTIIILSFIYFFLKNQSKQPDKAEIDQPDEDKYEYLRKSKSPKFEGIEIKSLIEYEDYYALGVHYPVTNKENIDLEISKLAKNYISQIKSYAKEFFTGPEPPGGFSSAWKYELSIDYNVNRFSSEIVSFKFDVYMYTGGAHTIHEIYTKTYNLESEKELILSDLFKEDSEYLDVISNLSYEQLVQSDRLGDLFIEDWVQEGTSPQEENFKNFALNENSIIFFFPTLQVGPWVAGEQYVEFEFTEIESLLNSKIIQESLDPGEQDDETIPEPPQVQLPEPTPITNDSKVIALTFDDGPHPVNTVKILNELKKRNVVATFFVLGNRAQYYPDLLIRILSEGSEIGNHTWNHKQLTKLPQEEILKQINDTQEIIKSLTNTTPKVMRPPYGAVDSRVSQEISMPIILWSVDPEDWKNKNSDTIIGHIITKTEKGDIILQHDLYEWTANSVGPIIDDLIEKGYKLVTVSQLLELDKKPVESIKGKIYYTKQ